MLAPKIVRIRIGVKFPLTIGDTCSVTVVVGVREGEGVVVVGVLVGASVGVVVGVVADWVWVGNGVIGVGDGEEAPAALIVKLLRTVCQTP